MPVVLKIRCDGEAVRVILEPALTFQDVRSAILKFRPEYAGGVLEAKYPDDEGDLCMLVERTFEDFLNTQLAKGRNLLRVELVRVDEPALPAASTQQIAPQGDPAVAADCSAGRPWRCRGDLSDDVACLHPRKMAWVLARLRAEGKLSSKMFAGITAHWMPNFKTAADRRGGDVWTRIAHCFGEDEQAVLAVFCSETQGLGEVAAKFSAGAVTGSVVQEIAAHMSALPFTQRVAMAESFYENAMEGILSSKLDQMNLRMPEPFKIRSEHPHVTCDGCGAHPLPGLRFKCSARPDYDLCGSCLANAKHPEHECAFKWVPRGSGMLQHAAMNSPPRACATPGCGFAATWHPTHCCVRCARKGTHGPRCQQAAAPVEAATCTSTLETQSAAGVVPNMKLSFPVEVGDGRRLVIDWNRGEDPQQVAVRFASQHGIMPDEIPQIVSFVKHASRESVDA